MIIPLMDFKTCKMIAVNSKHVQEITEGSEKGVKLDYPYSDVHIVNPEKHIDRVVRVVESKDYIERRLEEAKNAED